MCSRRGNALLTDQLVVGSDRCGGEHTQRIPPSKRLRYTYTNHNIEHRILYIILSN
jgi:hypothetical protein